MEFSTATRIRVPESRRSSVQASDSVKRRALARLYERRSSVDNLISALERYQHEQSRLNGSRVSPGAAETLS
jgi:hypothetical protein